MGSDGAMHADRDRAASFGAVAEQYERYRPAYPAELVDDLLRGDPRRVLDVGAGTGKAARALARPGRSVLCVEPDGAMADVARSFGLDVEVSTFEAWEPRERTFDLVTCAQAWHWVDPGLGAPKVASVLAPGGLFACFWNYPLPHPIHEAIAELQQRILPGHEFGVVDVGSSEDPYAEDLRNAGVFSDVVLKRYVWEEAFTAADWVGRLATRSDYLRLPEREREKLLAEVERLMAPAEPMTLPFGTYALFTTAPT